MADISQQTLAMSAQLRQVAHDAGGSDIVGMDRLLEPRRIGGMLSQPAEVELHTQSVLGTDAWKHLASQPMHLQQPLQPQVVPPMTPEGGASEMERHPLHADQQQQQRIAQTTQLLQLMAMQNATGDAPQEDFLQRVAAEISKQCSGEALVGWGGAVNAAPQGAPLWGCPWLQQVQSSGPAGGEESFGSDQRVEELNHYIRQQAQEYVEGQAEWSRQIAEVRSECLRELEKVKREKGEVERQARQELFRLQQRLREAGIKDEGAAGGDTSPGGPESPNRSVGSWAAGVSLEEFQSARRKCAAAEDRIRELEQYIKEQSAKQLLCADGQLKEKDEEIQKLRQIVVSNGMELRQATSELQALRANHQQKVLFWEHGARRLLSTAERFLGQYQRGEELEHGRFGRTATKLSLTLSEGEGGDVGSLRRLLKDVLKNGKDKGAKRSPQKTKAEGSLGVHPVGDAAADEQQKSGDEDGKLEDKPGEGDCSTPWTPGHRGPASTALSDSNPSSRETSPGRGVQTNGHGGPGAAQQARAAAVLMSQLVCELRQLIGMIQQDVPGSPQCLTPVDCSPRSGSVPPPSTPAPAAAPCNGSAQPDESQQVRQLLDGLGPMRRVLTTNIITVEKMLRGLDRDLRKQCEEILGQPELAVPAPVDPDAVAEEEEAQRCLPLSKEGQLLSLTGLRNAQQRSSAALAEFIQLPLKLKSVFDLIKKLGREVSGMVPSVFLRQAEAQVHAARGSEQRHAFHAEVLQQRLQTLNCKSASSLQPLASTAAAAGSEAPPLSPLQEASDEGDDERAKLEIQQELEQGVSCEDQLLATHVRLQRTARSLDSREDQLRSLEREIVELHMARYNERAQCMSFLQQQQSSALQGAKPRWWPWSSSGSTPEFGDQQGNGMPSLAAMYQQAWGSGAPGLNEWPTAPCVA